MAEGVRSGEPEAVVRGLLLEFCDAARFEAEATQGTIASVKDPALLPTARGNGWMQTPD